ncbi:MAG: TonB-dependent hemoglobin/transferrin/lactoferrin family receptor [Casimicrobiaceae bacterium]|nr:TonB-dependent hemoglobin/transferrin/lactoferrin family receptor [Casimicrobiaceae bacterium]MDW8312149.1 TonB-dependent hemoglobin/transferrin/lactoferrin family receptor [Burkholderiales bacterium]
MACAVSLAVATLAGSAPSVAQADLALEQAQLAQRVQPVVVSGARSERSDEETPAQVRLIDAEEIEKRQVQSIKDLVADEPGVTVRRAPARFSAAGSGLGRDRDAGFNIRGIEGNRVLIQVDGLRVPNAYSFGATNMGRGDYIDLATISRVEILRGPASALYGSDGLAGAVSFFTRTPEELLRRTRGPFYAALSGGYDSEDDSYTVTATVASRFDESRLLAVAAHRRGHEAENFGTNTAVGANRTAANPTDQQTSSGLFKWHYAVSPARRLEATFETTRTDFDVELLTSIQPRSTNPATLTIDRAVGYDTVRRDRGMLRFVDTDLGSPWADRLTAGLYAQSGGNRQVTYEFRSNGTIRLRDQHYDERFIGISADAEKTFTAGGLTHRVVYGFDAIDADYVALTDGNFPPTGETFPLKRFPDTSFRTFGAFVQDEIALDRDGRLLVIPALRYDRYRLAPEASPLYQGANPKGTSGDRVSPKLGLVWKFAPRHTAYANFAQGFRAPQPHQVNQGFTNLTSAAPYQTIANPNLKPETNRTVEVGIKSSATPVAFDLAAFYGRYRDFIEQVVVSGNGTRANPTTFQFVNLSGVRLRGAEASARVDWGMGFRSRFGIAYTKGDQITGSTRSPLNSVNPLRAIASLEWRAPSEAYGATLRAVHSARKRAADVTDTLAPTASQFLPPASTHLDLDAYWQFHPQGRLVVGVRNLTDKKYWEWTDVRGVAANSPILDAYTQSRRAVAATLRWEFK